MSDLIETTKKSIDDISLDLVSMDEDDIPALGRILNSLNGLEEDSKGFKNDLFMDLITGLKGYLEKMVLRETDDISPFEEGVECLQSIHHSICNSQDYKKDITPLLKKLGTNGDGQVPEGDTPETGKKKKPGKKKAGKKTAAGKKKTEEKDLQDNPSVEAEVEVLEVSEEDREIYDGFVFESMENLEAVEVVVVGLDQATYDPEGINTIFRAFHTIKGVAGFLNLKRINRLAHRAENLLDKIRNEELKITPEITDIILEVGDTLKTLIQGVQDGLEDGSNLDIGLDTVSLVNRIDGAMRRQDRQGGDLFGEILVKDGVVSQEVLDDALVTQKEEPEKKLGEILTEKKGVEPQAISTALQEQQTQQVVKRQATKRQVKVDTQKMDNLVDLTGELVIAQNMLQQNPEILNIKDQKLIDTLGQLNQITRGLQNTAMSLRMIPLKNTFQKMLRLVRDLNKASGKHVQLNMSGEDTEIDRNVVEELYDPMVHMIRNSVDHGIETPAEREKAGKKPAGTIHLKAYHKGGYIMVEIQDDGKGLDKKQILKKARDRKLVGEDEKLTDSEIFQLIFQPGFSTAKKVTEISGRGVGMDVVRKTIETLRGRVDIHSEPGVGTTFVISLPMTLAIIEGMVIRVGSDRYIIPALSILETFQPTREQYSTVSGKGEMILSRGDLLNLIRLDRVLECDGDAAEPWEGLVVTVEHEGKRVCLMLDEVLGKEEVVIKSLGSSMKHVKGLAGGAIMGDGRVGLIIDIAGIYEYTEAA